MIRTAIDSFDSVIETQDARVKMLVGHLQLLWYVKHTLMVYLFNFGPLY